MGSQLLQNTEIIKQTDLLLSEYMDLSHIYLAVREVLDKEIDKGKICVIFWLNWKILCWSDKEQPVRFFSGRVFLILLHRPMICFWLSN